MSESKKEPLYVRIVQECINTNSIRPEYEMWLTQEMNNSHDRSIIKEYIKYLKSLTPDKNGWVYWFLSQVPFHCHTVEKETNEKEELKSKYDTMIEYLKQSKECNHKYAQCEYIYKKVDTYDEEDLLRLSEDDIKTVIKELKCEFDKGNYRAAAYIFKMYMTII
jgi:hypothetical protein